MKTFLCATAAAALLMIPGISAASSLDYVQSGSSYTVLFDPNGSGLDNLPPSFFYRSYDCRIGSKPVVIPDVHVVTPPPPSTGNTGTPPADTNTTPPQDTGPAGYGPPAPTIITIPPPPTDTIVITSGNGDGGSTDTATVVPLPASSEMAGAGLAVIVLATWHRARRLARA
jgi:hypothetical protein